MSKLTFLILSFHFFSNALLKFYLACFNCSNIFEDTGFLMYVGNSSEHTPRSGGAAVTVTATSPPLVDVARGVPDSDLRGSR